MLLKLNRKFRLILRRVDALKRPIPHGLFGLAILLDRRDTRTKFHLNSLLSCRDRWPLAIWVPVQCFLALRWRLFHAARETDRAVSLYGAAIEGSENISLLKQRNIVLNLSKRFCIPPKEVYNFRIYRRPESALDYVFFTENGGVHRMKNGNHRGQDHIDIQDKAFFAERAFRIGLPCVPTLARMPRGQSADATLLTGLNGQGVFVKSRSGHNGFGAFSLQIDDETIRGRMLDGRAIESAEAAQAALRNLLTFDDVLVQPLLASHPLLRRAASSDDAVVLRITTQRVKDLAEGADILAAFLRIPMVVRSESGSGTRLDVIGRIDPTNGELSRNPNSILGLLPQTSLLEDWAFGRLPKNPKIPFWDEIRRQSLCGQRDFAELWAIGWDWVVTRDEPVLLEGNVYWEAKRPQEVAGGLVWAAQERGL